MRGTGADLASRVSWLVASRNRGLAAQCQLYEYLPSRFSEVPAILLKLGMPVPETAAPRAWIFSLVDGSSTSIRTSSAIVRHQ